MDTETKLKARIIKEIWITGVDRTKLDCSNPVSSYNNNNNNLHLYSANLYMNIFGCALQYCYIKFMLKVSKA